VRRNGAPFYFPLARPFLLLLAALVALGLGLVELGILSYAFEKVGIGHRALFALLVLSLLGSGLNLPIAVFPAERAVQAREIVRFGVRHVVPVLEGPPRTVLAVNVGGAVIPTAVSCYLLARSALWGPGLLAIAAVAAASHALARPVPGLGIAVPTLVPPVVAAAAALLLAPAAAPVVAYSAGSIGTLIGADLLNLGKLRGLGAPVASIGGAGTFDGIFVAGVLAAFLA
jgi:uncharacterized membrane protein